MCDCALTIAVVDSDPGVEEDRDEGQAHRDLVADHLRGGAERAEDGVRPARRPAGQHDAVDADRAHREHEQHRHRQVRDLQRGPVVEDRHHRAPRDDREGDERYRGRDDRRDEEHHLVHRGGDDVLLERQLERVGDRLQQAPGPGPVGTGPVLHPADHPALEPDHEDRGQQQEREDDADLEQHHPPDELVEVGQRRVDRETAGHSALLRVTLLPCPAARSARTAEPGLLAGSHTAPSAMSVTSSGHRHRARRGRHRHLVAVGEAGRGRGGRRYPGHRRACRSGQVRLAVLQPARVDELMPGSQPDSARRDPSAQPAASVAGVDSTARATAGPARPARRRGRRARRAPRPRRAAPGARPSRRRSRRARKGRCGCRAR